MEHMFGCVILAGGKGLRMGNVDKSGLLLKGAPFFSAIGEEMEALGYPCYFSLAEAKGPGRSGWGEIRDNVRGRENCSPGPMGAVYTCLKETGLSGLFFVPCDVPLFRKEIGKRALKKAEETGAEAVLWRTRDGRLHPLCAYYSREVLPLLKRFLEEGNYRMRDFLSSVPKKVILDTGKEHLPDIWFTNVNTPEAYEALSRHKTPVFAVSGRKNTGKTTLLVTLVQELSARGVRAAVIKHDGHDFTADAPGTDSYRLKEAGACGTAVYSDRRFCLVKEEKGLKAEDFFGYFPEADIILLEGGKDSPYPKIEVMRTEISELPVCRPETVAAYVKDWKGETDALLELILSYIDVSVV